MLDDEKVGHFFAYDQWCCGRLARAPLEIW